MIRLSAIDNAAPSSLTGLDPTEPNDKVPEPSVTNAVPFDPSDVGNV